MFPGLGRYDAFRSVLVLRGHIATSIKRNLLRLERNTARSSMTTTVAPELCVTGGDT
jgi:hypothetical protein